MATAVPERNTLPTKYLQGILLAEAE